MLIHSTMDTVSLIFHAGQPYTNCIPVSRVYRRRNLLEKKLQELDDLDAQQGSSPTSTGAQTLAATGVGKFDNDSLTHRKTHGPRYSTDLSKEESQVASIGQAIEAGDLLDAEQIQAFHRVLNTEITILNEELRGKCTTTDNVYPNNL